MKKTLITQISKRLHRFFRKAFNGIPLYVFSLVRDNRCNQKNRLFQNSLFILQLVFLTIFLNSGCKQIKKALLITPQEEKPTVKPVENLELAQAIVWPKPYQFSLPRDPFRPLLGKLTLPFEENLEINAESQIKVVGILVKKEKALTLLEVLGVTGIFREGDKIGEYTLKKIEPKKVILEKENKISVLEIGVEK